MINRFYDRAVNYIKYNFIFLLALILICIAFNIQTGYSIYKPGGSINVSDRITSNNTNINQSKGSINMAYVGMIEGKLPFYLLAKLLPSWDLVKNEDITYNDTETIKESLKRDHLYYEESISNAKILAYIKSNTDYTISKVSNNIIYVGEKCSADIKIGDEIVKYDNTEYTTLDDLKAYIKTKTEGDTIELIIKRENKEIKTTAKVYKEENSLLIGLAAVSIYDIDSDIKIEIASKASESGPSGGLMLSLAIYNALVDEDITKGNKIIGTGTIDIDGNVGEIGGVKYKLSGAVKEKADIFIVPKENLEEALAYAKEQKYDISIKGVSTFDEALNILKNLESK